jgi:hypothetical protein
MSSEAPIRDVVLLGAGASMAVGLPAAGGLTEHLLAARHALKSLLVPPAAVEAIDQDIAWLRDIQTRLCDILRHLSGFNPDNIEDVFRIWGYERGEPEIQMPGSPPNLIPGYQYPRLIRMLALALAYSPRYQSVRDLKQPNVYSWLVEQLVGTVKSGKQSGHAPIIVTTNYDLLIEFAISARSDVDLTYTCNDYSGLRNIFCREHSACCTLHYLKLHGSINWWGKRPGFRVSREGILSTINCDSPLATVAERYSSAGSDIEMVPPAVLKDVIYRAIWTDVWDEAHAVFCTCRHLVIIGYSFSQGDILVHNMVTLGLARSPYLESIVVIDPNANEVLARIKNYFSDEFISSKKWIGYKRRFDEETPHWASQNLFFGGK